MAQPSSAQREPSMEEILASIRRIIEDSDNVRKPGEAANEAGVEGAGQAAAEVEAFRAGLAPEEVSESHGAADPEPDGMDVEETFGNLDLSRAGQGDVLAAHHEADPAFPSFAAAGAGGHAEAGFEPVEAPVHESRTAIISDHAGRQVAAAFEELSDAFAASRRRGFDEMAEEMLRPMLQDWLDNNLPMLVEKLVREEIERVARGGRDG